MLVDLKEIEQNQIYDFGGGWKQFRENRGALKAFLKIYGISYLRKLDMDSFCECYLGSYDTLEEYCLLELNHDQQEQNKFTEITEVEIEDWKVARFGLPLDEYKTLYGYSDECYAEELSAFKIDDLWHVFDNNY